MYQSILLRIALLSCLQVPIGAFANSAESCYLPLSGASICPQVSELKLNPKTNEWKTDSDWSSTAGSFSRSVTSFLGAQWKGVELGYLLCLYQGPNKNEFPIGMHRNMVIQSPEKLWIISHPKGLITRIRGMLKRKNVQ